MVHLCNCHLTPDEDWMSVEIYWEENENLLFVFNLLFRYIDTLPNAFTYICTYPHAIQKYGARKVTENTHAAINFNLTLWYSPNVHCNCLLCAMTVICHTLILSLILLSSGVGWSMVLVSGVVSIYYNMIIAWALYYLGASFSALPGLPWENCNNTWNNQCKWS